MVKAPKAQIQHQRAGRVADGKANVLEQQPVKLQQRLIFVFTAGQRHFLEDKGMTADRALTKNHQVAREDVGPLHGDENRRPLPVAAQIVIRPHDDALAAVNIHCVANAFTAALGQVILENG